MIFLAGPARSRGAYSWSMPSYTVQAYGVFVLLLRLLGLRGRGHPRRDAGAACALYRAPAWSELLPRAPDPPDHPRHPPGARRGRCGHARAAAVLVALLARPAAFTALWLADGAADVREAGALCFLWLVPVQYAQAWRYLSIDHIDSHWMRCLGTHHPWFGVENQPSSDSEESDPEWFGVRARAGRLRCAPRFKRVRESMPSYVPVIFFGVLLVGSTLLAWLMTDAQLAESHILFFGPRFAGLAPGPGLRAVGRVLAIFDTVFGRVAQLLNAGVFLLVFCHHLEDMAHLVDLFRLRYTFQFAKILDRVMETQACLAHSTARLHGIFSSSSLLGGMGLALCLRGGGAHGGLTPYLVYCCVSHGVLQVIFCLVIRALAHRRRRLLDTAYSLKFTRACLHRAEPQNSVNIARDNGGTVDWLALTQLLEQRWVQFTLCGIDLQDGQLVTRCAWLVGLVVAGRQVLAG